jgi:hypothetical protein
MHTCCTFAFLVKSNFKISMVTSFAFTSLVMFYYNPSMATSSTYLLSFILFLNIFELKINLSKKHWNGLKFVSSFGDDMLRKVI